MGIAGGELTGCRQKVADLESALAGKEEELWKQTTALKQKEVAAQRFSKAQTKAEDRAKQLTKKLQDLEGAAACELWFCRLFCLLDASSCLDLIS